MKRIRESRLKTWQNAQKLEEQFWLQNRYRKVAQIDSKKEEAIGIARNLGKYINIHKEKRILQIGCGPDGIINFLGGLRFAIDPLMTVFNKEYNAILNKNVEFCKAIGEQLPFHSEFFDIIILNNVLDHTANSTKVLSEINRVLKRNSYLYLAVNVYSQLGYLLRKTILKRDKLHPYIYTKSSLTRQLKQFFTILNQTSTPQHGKLRRQKTARLYIYIRDLLLNQKFLRLVLLRN